MLLFPMHAAAGYVQGSCIMTLANFQVSHVEISTEYDWLFGVEFLHVISQVSIPFLLEGESFKTLTSVRNI